MLDNQKAKILASSLLSMPKRARTTMLSVVLRRYKPSGLQMVAIWYEKLSHREESPTVIEVMG